MDEGLELLDALRNTESTAVAANIAASYLSEFAQRIDQHLQNSTLTEPALKNLFRFAQLAEGCFAVDESEELSRQWQQRVGRIADNYIDALLEGYTPKEKAAELARIRKRLNLDND